jgi:ABC-type branched-subunit amino acid transport system substrate-binding protein
MSRRLVDRFCAALLGALFACSNPLSANEIVIGQTLDLSGATNLPKDFSSGLRAYFDAVNARGGVRGRKLSFVQLDDGGQPTAAASNVERLLRENRVQVLIGPTATVTLQAIAESPAWKVSSVALLGAPTGLPDALSAESRLVHVRANVRDEARAIVDFAQKTLGLKDFILVRGEGAEAESGARAIIEELRARGLAPKLDARIGALRLPPTSAGAGGEAVIVTGDAISVSEALRAHRELRSRAYLFGLSTVDHRTLVELLGPRSTGVVLAQVLPSADKAVHPFQREHRAQMKTYRDEPPSMHSLEGYLVARLLVSALERVEGEPTPARILAALRSLPTLAIGPMTVSLRDAGSATRFVNLMVVSRNGGLLD